MTRTRFDQAAIASVKRDLVIGVRAGSAAHRFTPVWGVAVEGRVFIRSWGLSERSWFHAFRREPSGVAQIGGYEYRVRAVRTRSERLLDAVDEAYRLKYHTASSATYVRDLNSERSRATTTELVPVAADARGAQAATKSDIQAQGDAETSEAPPAAASTSGGPR